mmetsp:Transcript_9412/g.29699  ORF Transcript_9412/g.29699 Transcript_9412/m.29699 type:complete len:254 (+) Transcript_9412:404-1165(+)
MPVDGNPRVARRLDHRSARAGRAHVGEPRGREQRRHCIPRRPLSPRARRRRHVRSADGNGVAAGHPRGLGRAMGGVGERRPGADTAAQMARYERDARNGHHQDGSLFLVQGRRAAHVQRYGRRGRAGQPERRALQRDRARRRRLDADPPVVLGVRSLWRAFHFNLYHRLVGTHRRRAGRDDHWPLGRLGVPRRRARDGRVPRPVGLARRPPRVPLWPKVPRRAGDCHAGGHALARVARCRHSTAAQDRIPRER